MKTMEDICAISVNEDITAYDSIIKKIQEAKDNNIPLEEGILGAIAGGILGAAAGPAVARAFCRVLGIDEKGQFGSLITSRLVTTALGAAIGAK